MVGVASGIPKGASPSVSIERVSEWVERGCARQSSHCPIAASGRRRGQRAGTGGRREGASSEIGSADSSECHHCICNSTRQPGCMWSVAPKRETVDLLLFSLFILLSHKQGTICNSATYTDSAVRSSGLARAPRATKDMDMRGGGPKSKTKRTRLMRETRPTQHSAV